MDREIVYAGAIPLETDILSTNKNTMLAIGNAVDLCAGTGTIVSRLQLLPTSPPSLTVQVGPGSIYAQEQVDSVAYGDLGTDTTHVVVKQGINLGYTQFTLTPPASGYTQLYLIQAQLSETDTGSTVLQYYNPTPPFTPFNGPSNSGTSQNTLRTSDVGLQLITTGVPYYTGSDPSATNGAVPAVSGGWVGLYLIPVNNGQTTITSTNLLNTLYPGAPFLPQKLSVQRLLLGGPVIAPISATGSDAWMQPTSYTPFLTLQHGVNYFSNGLDFHGQNGTLSLGVGTFLGASLLGTYLGQQTPITIAGAGSANTTLTASAGVCLNALSGAQVTLSGITILTAGSQYGISANGGATVNIGADVKFAGSAGIAHIAAGGAGQVNAPVGYTVVGSATTHVNAYEQANIALGGTITFSGSPAFTTVINSIFGFVGTAGATWAGSCTGTKYSVSGNGLLATGGTSASIPGSVAGGTSSGGQVL